MKNFLILTSFFLLLFFTPRVWTEKITYINEDVSIVKKNNFEWSEVATNSYGKVYVDLKNIGNHLNYVPKSEGYFYY